MHFLSLKLKKHQLKNKAKKSIFVCEKLLMSCKKINAHFSHAFLNTSSPADKKYGSTLPTN